MSFAHEDDSFEASNEGKRFVLQYPSWRFVGSKQRGEKFGLSVVRFSCEFLCRNSRPVRF